MHTLTSPAPAYVAAFLADLSHDLGSDNCPVSSPAFLPMVDDVPQDGDPDDGNGPVLAFVFTPRADRKRITPDMVASWAVLSSDPDAETIKGTQDDFDVVLLDRSLYKTLCFYRRYQAAQDAQ